MKDIRARPASHKNKSGARTRQAIDAFFDLLQDPRVGDIDPSNRWAVGGFGYDERTLICRNILGQLKNRASLKVEGESRLWISVLECVSATGESLPPSIVYQSMSLQRHEPLVGSQGQIRERYISAEEEELSLDQIALQWLEKIFVPFTTPSQGGDPPLLILDDHASYKAEDFLWTCFQNNILLLFLPERASDVLQPLHMAVSEQLRAAYKKVIPDFVISRAAAGTKRLFLTAYFEAREEALTPENIKAGWSESGLWPENRDGPLHSAVVILRTLDEVAGQVLGPKVYEMDDPKRILSSAFKALHFRRSLRELRRQARIEPDFWPLYREHERKVYKLERTFRGAMRKAWGRDAELAEWEYRSGSESESSDEEQDEMHMNFQLMKDGSMVPLAELGVGTREMEDIAWRRLEESG